MLCNDCKHSHTCKHLCDAAIKYASQDDIDTNYPHDFYDYSTDDPNDYDYLQDLFEGQTWENPGIAI